VALRGAERTLWRRAQRTGVRQQCRVERARRPQQRLQRARACARRRLIGQCRVKNACNVPYCQSIAMQTEYGRKQRTDRLEDWQLVIVRAWTLGRRGMHRSDGSCHQKARSALPARCSCLPLLAASTRHAARWQTCGGSRESPRTVVACPGWCQMSPPSGLQRSNAETDRECSS
jgi:hypothetical protein